ncbi:MAG: PHP domain-containing protein [Actinomycetota bacterium]|nr:PHP domain-containing protein [Actinomycetota bacterium]
MKVKLDLHVHTLYSFDSSIEPEGLRRACRERGIDGMAVTDHDSLRGGLVFAAELPDLLIIPGSEIRSREGEIIGLFLEKDVPPGLSAPKTMRLIHEQGGLVIIPHPFDYVKARRMTARRLRELQGELDAVEAVNGKPRYWGANKRAGHFADTLGIPVTGGSDAHSLNHIGLVYTEMEEFSRASEFLISLDGAVIHGSRYSPWASQLERWKARTRRNNSG